MVGMDVVGRWWRGWWHGCDWRLVGLVILSFNSHRDFDWCLDWFVGLLWVCLFFCGYLVGFIFFFFFFFFWVFGSSGILLGRG